RPHRVARLHPPDELGRAEGRLARASWHTRGLHGMTAARARPPRVRPDVKYLVAAGLLGFVIGAFVVASLGSVRAVGDRRGSPKPADTIVTAALDDAGSPVVEASAATSGRSVTHDERALAGRDLEIPVKGVTSGQLV